MQSYTLAELHTSGTIIFIIPYHPYRYMIQAFLSYNQTSKETLFKAFYPISTSLQNNIIQNFTNYKNISNENYLQIEIYFITFIIVKNTLFSLISEDENDKIEMQYILNYIKPLLSDNFFDVNFIISEIFPFSFMKSKMNYNLLYLENLKNILVAESNDERIYENMMKSKELDNYKKLKEMKKVKNGNIDKQLEKVRNIELEMRKEQIKQLEALKISNEHDKASTGPKKVKQRLNLEGDFVVSIKEKINVVVDKEMNVKECYLNGDLSVLIRKDEFRKEEIKFVSKNNLKDSYKAKEPYKFSPNINKEKAKLNVLYSEKGFPLNKNVALMKWKRKTELPLDFSFWMSETNDNKFSVQFEYETKCALKDLTFYFNKKNVLIENCNVIDGKYEWKGENNSIEIICNAYEDLFPVYVDFWCEDYDYKIDVDNEKINLVKIFEVEKFEILY